MSSLTAVPSTESDIFRVVDLYHLREVVRRSQCTQTLTVNWKNTPEAGRGGIRVVSLLNETTRIEYSGGTELDFFFGFSNLFCRGTSRLSLRRSLRRCPSSDSRRGRLWLEPDGHDDSASLQAHTSTGMPCPGKIRGWSGSESGMELRVRIQDRHFQSDTLFASLWRDVFWSSSWKWLLHSVGWGFSSGSRAFVRCHVAHSYREA